MCAYILRLTNFFKLCLTYFKEYKHDYVALAVLLVYGNASPIAALIAEMVLQRLERKRYAAETLIIIKKDNNSTFH